MNWGTERGCAQEAGPLEGVGASKEGIPYSHCVPLQLWPPRCWANLWPSQRPPAHLPSNLHGQGASRGPAGSAANASTGSGDKQGDKAAPGERTVSLSDSTVP